MTVSQILAPGNDFQTSSDVAVIAGAAITVGLYVPYGPLPSDAYAEVFALTPGVPSRVAVLTGRQPTAQVLGPCTVNVQRRAGTGTFGIYKDV